MKPYKKLYISRCFLYSLVCTHGSRRAVKNGEGLDLSLICRIRTTHVHDDSRRAAPVHMCALRMRVGLGAQERLQLNRTWKVSIIYTWLVKTFHSVLFSFCTFSCSRPALLASTVPWLRCLLFLNAANHRLRSVLNSAKRVRCRGPTALFYWSSIVKNRRSSLSSIIRLGIWYSPARDVEFLCIHASANWHSRAWQTRTYIRTYIARIDPPFKASC